MAQIPLPLAFDQRFSLQNYISDKASHIVAELRGLFDGTGETLIGLWGGQDSGKTHLLNACAHYARDCQLVFQLFDANQLQHARAEDFADIPGGGVIGIDNVDLLAGLREWEIQIYQLINRVKQGELRLVFSTSRTPRDIGFRLPDLKSRLLWGLLLHLETVDDHQLEKILRERAKLLGLVLTDDVLHFLSHHLSRKISEQIEVLHQLDREALSQQRRITIPFIKQTLEM